MMQSVLTITIATAAALVQFGCGERGPGPADPKPPKAIAASVLPDTTDTPLRSAIRAPTPALLPR